MDQIRPVRGNEWTSESSSCVGLIYLPFKQPEENTQKSRLQYWV